MKDLVEIVQLEKLIIPFMAPLIILTNSSLLFTSRSPTLAIWVTNNTLSMHINFKAECSYWASWKVWILNHQAQAYSTRPRCIESLAHSLDHTIKTIHKVGSHKKVRFSIESGHKQSMWNGVYWSKPFTSSKDNCFKTQSNSIQLTQVDSTLSNFGWLNQS